MVGITHQALFKHSILELILSAFLSCPDPLELLGLRETSKYVFTNSWDHSLHMQQFQSSVSPYAALHSAGQ